MSNYVLEPKFYYQYNKNGRKVDTSDLAYRLYRYYSTYKGVFRSIPKNTEYNKEPGISELLDTIRKSANKSYYYGFPRYIKMDVNRANKILAEKSIPFVIEDISSDGSISSSYCLKYVGDFKVEERYQYIDIWYLDCLYDIFMQCKKHSPISSSNMEEVVKNIEDIIDKSAALRHVIPKFYLDDINGITKILEAYHMPFSISQSITPDSRKYYYIE